ncbi:MAG: hypothetical protein MUE31_09100, partial [Candidatus Nanopelagicales bacterium]|nr:hypothetical protein [Candidatus Nanopelagicales bacterium]
MHEIFELKRLHHPDALGRLTRQRKDLSHATGFALGCLLCRSRQASQNDGGDWRGGQHHQKQYRLLTDH